MESLDGIDKAVLQKLLTRRVIGSKHIRLTTLTKCGWKPNERDRVKASVEKLLQLKYIVWAKKSKKAITLNKELVATVIALVGRG